MKFISRTQGVALIAAVCLVIPSIATAETVLRVGDAVTVTAEQRVEEDFYAAGGTVAMSGTIAGDMYVVGGSVTTNGTILEDLTVLGGTVAVHAPVSDDVRVVGGDVTIGSEVVGDVFVLSGSLTILSSASVAGDVFFYGGEGTIDGAVAGSVMGAAERFRIDSTVGGDIDVKSSRPLTLGDRAAIGGDVRYESFGELVRAQNAVIEGSVTRNEPREASEGSSVSAAITTFVISLFAALCAYLLAKRELLSFVSGTIKNYGRSGVLGIATLVLMPIGAVLLMLTVLGLLVGVIGLFLFLLLFFTAAALASVTLGGVISLAVTKRIEVNLMWIAIGALALNTLLYIPFIGFVLVCAVCILTLGNLVWMLYRYLR